MYGEAFPLLARNPSLFLAPLFTGVIDVFVQEFAARTGSGDALGGITGGIMQLLIFIIDSFGLAVSLIIADRCWRRGKSSFDEGWEEARRRVGDIFMAALGLNFVIYVALQIGSFISPYLGIALFAVAFFFLIYTLPAASIGGIPGAAALNVSIERVRADFPTAIGLAICFVVLYWLIGTFLVPLYTADLGVASFLIAALVKAIALGYFALVLAKGYGEVSYR
jgi:hypothetical protein